MPRKRLEELKKPTVRLGTKPVVAPVTDMDRASLADLMARKKVFLRDNIVALAYDWQQVQNIGFRDDSTPTLNQLVELNDKIEKITGMRGMIVGLSLDLGCAALEHITTQKTEVRPKAKATARKQAQA